MQGDLLACAEGAHFTLGVWFNNMRSVPTVCYSHCLNLYHSWLVANWFTPRSSPLLRRKWNKQPKTFSINPRTMDSAVLEGVWWKGFRQWASTVSCWAQVSLEIWICAPVNAFDWPQSTQTTHECLCFCAGYSSLKTFEHTTRRLIK